MNGEATGLSNKLLWLVLVVALMPWFYIQSQHSINANIATLTVFAQRLLEGGHFYTDIYDTNPPLNILIQTPPALLHKFLGIPVYYAVFGYALMLLALSCAAVKAILHNWEFLSTQDRHILLLLYIVSDTVLASLYLGDRDHIVLLGLYPFILWQAGMTMALPLPQKLKWPVLFGGAFVLMLKPHYGLLPTLMLIHRAIRQKRITVYRDPDFIALAAVTAGYALALALIFTDFTHRMLPAIIALYQAQTDMLAIQIAAFMAVFILVMLLVVQSAPLKKPHKNFITFLFTAALVNLVPFIVQMKGFYYHLIPFIVFSFTGLGFFVFKSLEGLSAKYVGGRGAPLWVAAFLMTALAYALMPPNTAYPSHSDYRNFALTKLVKRYCTDKPDCRFFLFNDMIEMIPQTAVYADVPHGSRFPVYWFLPAMLESSTKSGKYKPQFAELAGADFQKYKPDLLVIGRFKLPGDNTAYFNFGEYFSANKTFAREWQNYRHMDTIMINRRIYFWRHVAGHERR